ncbi:MAG: NADH-quinone oxidoreductase subunit F [Rhodospirillaceae bacterium]|jgi:formate dehydrogenase beta subunit|nr:NADH-quinone oxidoreductase subunit F [Rhodospirillaceae bacterium]MBT5753072.1 NADH-quinone oxidoreductase subunit F [Rhodospirillaceae bacterium]
MEKTTKKKKAGRNAVIRHPKGRRVKQTAFTEVGALLGDKPRTRDSLIEFLHLVQDKYNCLTQSHLAALAHELKISFAEVYEVATFYAHFDVVKDSDPPMPKLTIRVCDSLSCEMQGAQSLLVDLLEKAGKDIRVLPAPCMGRCDHAPVAEIGHYHVEKASTASVLDAVKKGEFSPEIPAYTDFRKYREDGGYDLLWDCLTDAYSPDEIIDTLSQSELRGMGGAGFPAGQKWGFVLKEPGPRLMTINADEGEPGTFKDKFYLETDPHRFLEGMMIAAWAVEATDVYIYLRDEYPGVRKILQTEIAKIEAAGLSDRTHIHLRRGAGAYICGEESAMLESIEGKRGLPRHRPPYISTIGLFGRPTLNHNVETVFWIRDIIEKGAHKFADQGRHDRKGLRSYSVSGRIKNPGVKLAPAGTTMNELIEEFCGGMEDGHSFKAYLPGGASGGILPAKMADIPLDFGTLEEHGCFIGSAAVIVLSDKDNMRDVALNLLRFFEYESCGQCTPCRVGTEKAVKLMAPKKWDTALLTELCGTMTSASICGLGQAAGNPILSVIKHFPEDFE